MLKSVDHCIDPGLDHSHEVQPLGMELPQGHDLLMTGPYSYPQFHEILVPEILIFVLAPHFEPLLDPLPVLVEGQFCPAQHELFDQLALVLRHCWLLAVGQQVGIDLEKYSLEGLLER
jgi:hypothetical protein